MKVLITGGAGYIGSAATLALLESGHEVLVYDNLSSGSKSGIPAGAQFVDGDLRDQEKLVAALTQIGAEAVFHCAGISAVGNSLQTPGLYYQSVISSGVDLLGAMVATGCKRIISTSSYAVYGLPEKMPVDERTPAKPITPAGHAFLTFEQIMEWYRKIYDIQSISLRLFSAAGAMNSSGKANLEQDRLISRILAVVYGAEEFVPVYGDSHVTPDGTCIRDYVHVEDVATAFLSALSSERSGIFNIGSGEGQSVNQVLDCARRETGHEIPVRIMPAREGDPPRLVAAWHRAKMEWKWQPKYQRFKDIFETSRVWAEAHPDIFTKVS
jgi:UDP-glucose 4-epimerase